MFLIYRLLVRKTNWVEKTILPPKSSIFVVVLFRGKPGRAMSFFSFPQNFSPLRKLFCELRYLDREANDKKAAGEPNDEIYRGKRGEISGSRAFAAAAEGRRSAKTVVSAWRPFDQTFIAWASFQTSDSYLRTTELRRQRKTFLFTYVHDSYTCACMYGSTVDAW